MAARLTWPFVGFRLRCKALSKPCCVTPRVARIAFSAAVRFFCARCCRVSDVVAAARVSAACASRAAARAAARLAAAAPLPFTKMDRNAISSSMARPVDGYPWIF